VLLIVEPSAFVAYLGGSLHVGAVLSDPTIILQLSRVLVSIGVFHEASNEFIVLKGALELGSIVQF
jgi:hypothetical protein